MINDVVGIINEETITHRVITRFSFIETFRSKASDDKIFIFQKMSCGKTCIKSANLVANKRIIFRCENATDVRLFADFTAVAKYNIIRARNGIFLSSENIQETNLIAFNFSEQPRTTDDGNWLE